MQVQQVWKLEESRPCYSFNLTFFPTTYVKWELMDAIFSHIIPSRSNVLRARSIFFINNKLHRRHGTNGRVTFRIRSTVLCYRFAVVTAADNKIPWRITAVRLHNGLTSTRVRVVVHREWFIVSKSLNLVWCCWYQPTWYLCENFDDQSMFMFFLFFSSI